MLVQTASSQMAKNTYKKKQCFWQKGLIKQTMLGNVEIQRNRVMFAAPTYHLPKTCLQMRDGDELETYFSAW